MTTFPWIFSILVLFLDKCSSTSKFTQPLGISGKFLTTSIGIGTPPRYFDVALSTNDDSFFLFDYSINNGDLDYQYDYIKNMFIPEASRTCELGDNVCRVRQLDNGSEKSAFGSYTNDYISLGITMYGLPIRFCKIKTDRSGTSTYNDPLQWLYKQPVDGFLGLGLGTENPLSKMRASTGSNQITLWLDKDYTEIDRAGLVTFGGPNYYQCSQTTKYILLDDEDSWMFFINKVTFKSYSDTSRGLGMFDLTSDYLTVPRNTFQGIKSYYGDNLEQFYCDDYQKSHNIKMDIYGITYDIDLTNFVAKLESVTGYCELRVTQAAAQDEVQIIFGKQILKQYCVTLDYDNYYIGMAESKN